MVSARTIGLRKRSPSPGCRQSTGLLGRTILSLLCRGVMGGSSPHIPHPGPLCALLQVPFLLDYPEVSVVWLPPWRTAIRGQRDALRVELLAFKSLAMTARLVAFGMYRERFLPCHLTKKISATIPAMTCSCGGWKCV